MFGCESDCGFQVGTLTGQMSVEISVWPLSAYLIEHSACHVPLFGNLPVHTCIILADKNNSHCISMQPHYLASCGPDVAYRPVDIDFHLLSHHDSTLCWHYTCMYMQDHQILCTQNSRNTHIYVHHILIATHHIWLLLPNTIIAIYTVIRGCGPSDLCVVGGQSVLQEEVITAWFLSGYRT